MALGNISSIASSRVLWGSPDCWRFTEGRIDISQRLITGLGKNARADLDVGDCYVLPGFVDLHTHGALGSDFAHGSPEEYKRLNSFYASHGVTIYLPTLSSLSLERTINELSHLSKYNAMCDRSSQFPGIHLEGPCLNEEYAGAQNREDLLLPSPELYQQCITAAGGLLAMVTIAPELSGGISSIDYLNTKGVKVNIGHSNATFDKSIEAFQSGAGCVTHFLNAMRPFHQHEPAIPGAVAVSPNIMVEFICDGFHLAASTVAVLAAQLDISRMIAVTDSIIAAGLDDGIYDAPSFSQKLVIKHGDAQILDTGIRAGSTLTMDQALRNIMIFTNLPIEDTVRCVSYNPCFRMGWNEERGCLKSGMFADMTILDSEFHVKATIKGGELVYLK